MLYNLCRVTAALLFKLAFRWQVTGRENIPKTGGVIVAANHVSLLDPPVLGAALPRKVRFMAKEELFRNAAFGYIITRLGAFPVRRGAPDRTAIRTALNLLEKGELLGMFPEGTRSKTGRLGEAEPGLALLAHRSGVPVVPAAIKGTNELFGSKFLPQVIVRFGKPLAPPSGRLDKETMDSYGRKVMAEIAALLTEKQ